MCDCLYKKILIPSNLKVDRPNELPDFTDRKERLKVVFSVPEVLPPNITARVIVRRSDHHEICNENWIWKNGAVLQYGKRDTIALIEEDKRHITVQVKGSAKESYIRDLRDTLRSIFESYREINPKLMYEVLLPAGYDANNSREPLSMVDRSPLMVDESTVQGHMEGNEDYYDATNRRKFPLNSTCEAYGINYNIYYGEVHMTQTVEIKGSPNSNVTQTISNEDYSHSEDNSSHDRITIEIRDSVFHLQGYLNGFARSLRQYGLTDEAEHAEEVAKAVEAAQETMDTASPETAKQELIKKGLKMTIGDFFNDLSDEDSDLRKKVDRVGRLVKLAQRTVEMYKKVAPFFFLP